MLWCGVWVWACTPEVVLDAEGKAPTASLLSPTDGATVPKGRLVAEGRVSDLQDPPFRLFVVWSLRDVDGAWRDVCDDFAEEDGTTRCLATVTPADDTLRLRVTDLAGFQRDVVHALDVVDASAPTVVLTGPDPQDGPLYADRAVRFEADIDDEQDALSTLDLTWRSDQQGVLDGPTVVPSFGPLAAALSLQEGFHEVSLEVRDPFGLTAVDTVNVLVGGDNVAPTCRLDAPEEGAVGATGAPWIVSGFSRDPEWGARGVLVEVSSDVDGLVATTTLSDRSAWSFDDVSLSKGAHTLTVRTEDHVGARCERSVTVLVDDPPTLSVASPLPDAVVAPGGYLTVQATLDHPTHPPEDLRLRVSSDLTGPFPVWTPDEEGLVDEVISLANGNHQLTFVAEDPNGLQSPVVLREVAKGIDP